MSNFFWSEEDKQRVAVLLHRGLPASKIATQLGCSRNAIIGVVSRDPMLRKIGLHGRANPSKPGAPARPRNTVSPSILLRTKRLSQPRTHGRPDPVAPAPLHLALFDLTSDQCKWPVNDPPKGEAFTFCGHPRTTRSYCEYHAHRNVRHDH